MYMLNRHGDKTEDLGKTISLESPGAAFVTNVHVEASVSEKQSDCVYNPMWKSFGELQ